MSEQELLDIFDARANMGSDAGESGELPAVAMNGRQTFSQKAHLLSKLEARDASEKNA